MGKAAPIHQSRAEISPFVSPSAFTPIDINDNKIEVKGHKNLKSPDYVKSEITALQGAELILSEDFSGCTAGSEAAPDATAIVGELPAGWTKTTGWRGATASQAGGCLFLDEWVTSNGSSDITVYLLDTPELSRIHSNGLARVSFRARSKAGSIYLYLINADAYDNATLGVYQMTLTNAWREYEVYVSDLVATSFIEFQADEGAFFIDDIRVEAYNDLDTPAVKPATDITLKSYTANWAAVANADGYLVYPKTIHTADGMEPYWLIDADFESVKEGTLDAPIEPTVAVESLDSKIAQSGWLVRLPLFAKGALGLTNKYLDYYGNSLLQSPTLNLSNAGGQVEVDLKWLAQDVDMFQVCMYELKNDGRVSLRSTKMIYTYEDYNKWKESKFTIGGGTAASLLVIILPETTKGTVFFDHIRMSQTLEEGTRYIVPGATVTSTKNSAKVDTPDATANDVHTYTVRAYRYVGDDVLISEESNSLTLGRDNEERPETLAAPQNVAISGVNGAQFTSAWPAVDNANAYEVTLYRRHESNGNESVAVVNEDFNAIRVGTTDLDYPRLMHEDGYDRLDEFTNVPGWEVFQGFYVDGAVGILGYWNMLGVGCYMRSPIFDLSGDDGNMTLSLKVGTDYYEQGATVYLAHDDPETGATVYDDILPLNEMSKGFHAFTKNFKGGRKDSYLVFFPYGYGMSYFDDILVTQRVPAGISDTQISRRIVSDNKLTMTVPTVNVNDEYYIKVRALWLDNMDHCEVESGESTETQIQGLLPATHYAGKVTDADGNGVAGATVMLLPDGDRQRALTATSNRWGLFRVENVSDVKAPHTVFVTAPGYRGVSQTGVTFANLQPVTDAQHTLRAVTDDSVEIGMPSAQTEFGPLYLLYNASDSETIYPADALQLPKGAVITDVIFDAYCEEQKEYTADVTVRLENVPAKRYNEAAPMISDETPDFWKGTVTLDAVGEAGQPDKLLHFNNENGFAYTGESLLVSLESRAKKNSEFYFLADGSRESSSIYRYGSREPLGDWKINKAGMPVMRLIYTDPSMVGVSSVSVAEDLTLTPGKGVLTMLASTSRQVAIYAPDGRLVKTVTLHADTPATVSLSAGIYIVGNKKTIIK